MRGRALAIAVGVAVVVVALVVVVEATGRDQNAAPAAAAQAIPVVLPLAASTTTASAATVLLPMGHLDDPTNTFWELFVRAAGSSAWRLRTPPGVADNGGLVVSNADDGTLTAGFLSSQNLTFSPISQSADQGRQWDPGQLPAELVAAPDNVATSGSSLLALVGEHGQTVLSSDGNLSTWSTLSTRSSISRSTAGCAVTGITAVAIGSAGQPLLGVACGSDGRRIGVVEGLAGGSGTSRSRWTSIGPELGSGGPATTTVLRLQQTTAGTAGLAEVHGAATSLVAFWGQGSPVTWQQSSRLAVPVGWTVEATGVGGGAGQAETVLLGSGDLRRVEVVAGPGSAWEQLPAAPASTAVVATVGSETDAMVGSGSLLTVWAWSPGQSSWRRTAVTTVAIPYGSSD